MQMELDPSTIKPTANGTTEVDSLEQAREDLVLLTPEYRKKLDALSSKGLVRVLSALSTFHPVRFKDIKEYDVFLLTEHLLRCKLQVMADYKQKQEEEKKNEVIQTSDDSVGTN